MWGSQSIQILADWLLQKLPQWGLETGLEGFGWSWDGLYGEMLQVSLLMIKDDVDQNVDHNVDQNVDQNVEGHGADCWGRQVIKSSTALGKRLFSTSSTFSGQTNKGQPLVSSAWMERSLLSAPPGALQAAKSQYSVLYYSIGRCFIVAIAK